MTPKLRFLRLGLAFALLAAAMSLGTAAGQGGPPVIGWWVFASGGGSASGGNVVLQDTFGQTVAGLSSDGQARLYAGFWPLPGLPIQRFIYLPSVMK